MVKTILGKVKGFLDEGFLETNLFHVGLAWRYHRFRSSFPKLFFKIIVPQNSVKFTGKQLCRNFSFNKFAGWRPATL